MTFKPYIILLLCVIYHSSSAQQRDFDESMSDAQAKLEEAQVLYDQEQKDQAKSLFEEAAQIFLDNEQIGLYCRSKLKVANILGLENQNEEALKICEQLQSEFESTLQKDPFALGLLYAELGSTHNELRNVEKAIDFGQKAEALLSLVKDKHPTEHAEVQVDLAVAYNQNQEPHKSLPYLDYAEKIFLSDSISHLKHLSNLYINKSSIYGSLGFLAQAEESIKKGVLLRESIFGIDNSRNGSIYNMAATFFHRNNNYHQALNYYNKAIQLYQKSLPDPHVSLAYINMNMGALFMNLGDYHKTRDHVNTSMRMIEALFGVSNRVTAIGYNYLGYSAEMEGKFEESQTWFEKSLKMNLELFEENNHDVGVTCRYLAGLFKEQGKLKEANEYAERSLRIFQAIKDPKNQNIATSYQELAEINVLQKDLQKALEVAQKGLMTSAMNFENPDLNTNPEADDILDGLNVINFLLVKSNVSLMQYDQTPAPKLLQRAKSSLLRGVEVANILWRQNQRLEDLIDFSPVLNKLYEGLSQIHIRQYRSTEEQTHLDSAFFYTEKGREITLRALTNSWDASLSFNVPDSLKRKEAELERLTIFYESQLRPTGNSLDSTTREEYRSYLFKTRRDLENLQEYFKQEVPEYYGLKYNNEVINFPDIQAQLKDGQALLEYAIIDSTIHIFTVLKNKVDFKSIPIQDSFEAALAYFTDQNRFSPAIAHDLESFKTHAFNLYRQLLSEPLARLDSEIQELIIAPPPSLSTLSWEILLQDQSGSQFNQLNYLLKDFSVSYAPSSSWRFAPRTVTFNRSTEVLAFAPVYTNNETKPIAGLTEVFRDALVPLNWNQPEVLGITDQYGGEPVNAEIATERAFKSKAPDYQILHLAMHALVDHTDAMNSKLVFTQDNDSIEDGMLHTFEIFNMDLNADMVVLSACNTGIGKVKEGEGVMSLARAFAYAGVPSMVMSHWNVNDESTSKLMVSFYEYLSEGDKKDEALRKAKLDFLSEANEIQTNPFYWGGFVLVGDNSPIDQQENYYWWLLLALPALGGFWLSRKKR